MTSTAAPTNTYLVTLVVNGTKMKTQRVNAETKDQAIEATKTNWLPTVTTRTDLMVTATARKTSKQS